MPFVVRIWVLMIHFQLLAGGTILTAAETEVLSPPQRFIVISEAAPLMVGDEQARTLPLGTVIEAIRTQGNWRYTPAQNGWLHTRDLVPMNQAVERFSKQIEANPTSGLYQLRGIARLSQNEWPLAAQDFEKAYDLGESSIALHLNLGTCYTRMGELGPAIEEYDSILKTYPEDFSALLARGNLLLQQGQYRSALRDLEQASQLRPDSAEAQNSRGVVLRMIGRYEDAIEAYTLAIELDPERADALSNRAYAKKSLGDYAAALADYEAAVKLAPDSVAIQNDFAWLLATTPDETLRDGPRALTLSESVCEQTKNKNGEYLDTLAAAYASVQRYPAAEEAALLAISMMGDHPGVPRIRERLQLYQKEQPYLETPAVPEPEKESGKAPETGKSKDSEPEEDFDSKPESTDSKSETAETVISEEAPMTSENGSE